MTEGKWLRCEDWRPMLEFLSGRVTKRKGLLYVSAGLRCIWELLYHEASREAVVVAEREADGEATADETQYASWSAEVPTFGYHFQPEFIRQIRGDGNDDPGVTRLLEMGVYSVADITGGGRLGDEQVVTRLVNAAHIAFHCLGNIDDDGLSEHLVEHLSDQAEWPGGWLVREMFGNPFRPVGFAPEWRTKAALAIARGAYSEREFDHLPILADALEEAGCGDAVLLEHLRSPGPHYRGCFALDLVLAKE